MSLKNSPSSSPLLRSLEALTPEEQREQVKTMRAAEMQNLVEEMKNDPTAPARETQEAIERRMAELGMAVDMKSMKEGAANATQGITDKAEASFSTKLMEKAGGWGVVGTGLLAVLSWFGFSKAKALRESLKTKGYLRTAVEGAKDHPIFAAFVAALGVSTSVATFKYLQNNAEPITEAIADNAKKMGIPGVDAAKSVADKLRAIIGTGVDIGLKGTAMGIASVLGGNYDEESGIVTLPHASLHPPVLIAYTAGFRRHAGEGLTRGTYSRFVVEDRLSALLKQGGTAVKTDVEARVLPKTLLAKRGLEILQKSSMSAADEAEIGRIISALEPDLNLNGKAVAQVQADPVEAKKHLDELTDTMKKQSVQEIETYNTLKTTMQNELLQAEENLKNGRYTGTAEEYKKSVIDKIEKQSQAYRDDLTMKKITVGTALEDGLNALQGTVGDHARANLDDVTHGRGRTGAALETLTHTAETSGYKMFKLPGGKYVMRGIIGYSFLPLALEGAAALRPGEAGDAAKQALIVDATDAGLGFIPVVGELNDFRAAIMGTDLNGRELDTTARITAGVMGGLGTASIVAGFFTGGATIAGFRIFRLALSSKKAVNAARMAQNGVTAVSVTSKTLEATDKATDAAKALENMSQITQTQKMARSARNAIHNAQRGMQLYTYSTLGYSLAMGAAELYNSADGIVGSVQNKALEGINAVEKFATGVQ